MLSAKNYLKNISTPSVPKIIICILMIIGTIPLKFASISSFMISFEVAAIFYWSIYRPKMLPKSFMVLLGIFQDLLYFNPVGISAITNLAAQSVMLSQRKIFIKEPFWVLWLGFGLFCFGTSIFKWSALSLLRGELINPTNAMMQFLLSLASYPIMHSTLGVIHSFLPKSREDNA